MGLNPNIWLPHLKFILQTIAITYPARPNDVSRRKYYDLIQNLPVYFPFNPIGKNFVNEAKRRRSDIILGADFISGFPTETEKAHRNT